MIDEREREREKEIKCVSLLLSFSSDRGLPPLVIFLDDHRRLPPHQVVQTLMRAFDENNGMLSRRVTHRKPQGRKIFVLLLGVISFLVLLLSPGRVDLIPSPQVMNADGSFLFSFFIFKMPTFQKMTPSPIILFFGDCETKLSLSIFFLQLLLPRC